MLEMQSLRLLTGLFTALPGLGFILNSVWLVLLGTPAFIVLNVIELKVVEEPELERRFGSSYSVDDGVDRGNFSHAGDAWYSTVSVQLFDQGRKCRVRFHLEYSRPLPTGCMVIYGPA